MHDNHGAGPPMSGGHHDHGHHGPPHHDVHRTPSAARLGPYVWSAAFLLACLAATVAYQGLTHQLAIAEYNLEQTSKRASSTQKALEDTRSDLAAEKAKSEKLSESLKTTGDKALATETKLAALIEGLKKGAEDQVKQDAVTQGVIASLGSQIKQLTKLLDMEKSLRDKEIAALKDELKKALADPRVGKDMTALMEVDVKYGESEYGNVLNFKKKRTAPDKDIVAALRAVHEAALGKYFKDDPPTVEPWTKDALEDKTWTVGYPKKDPRTFMDQILHPKKGVPHIVGIQVYVNGTVLTWSRTPTEAQQKSLGPALEALARSLGHEPGEGRWHTAAVYVFKP